MTTNAISAVPGCQKCTYAGSLRRMRETIGDVDILAAAADSKPLMQTFVDLPLVSEVIVRGPKKTSVRTSRGLQVDLRVVPYESWGAALQYFTGSKQHNVRTREIAVRKGLRLSEYGLFRVDDDTLVSSETEEAVYAELGLAHIAPTLREDRGEVDAALNGTLPDIVTQGDIRGDLHTHTTLTDGVSTLEEMLAAAAARGLKYYAVTDHAKDLPMQRMTDAKMLAQRERLRELAGGRASIPSEISFIMRTNAASAASARAGNRRSSSIRSTWPSIAAAVWSRGAASSSASSGALLHRKYERREASS